MTLTLRPYQQQAVASIRAALAAGHRSVLFVLPTGGGKTVIFSHIAQQAASKGNRICILVHRVELLEQASASLQALGVRHGLIAAGRSMDLSAPVQIASVATLARRLHKLSPELFQLLVVDEAHHSNAGTWGKVLSHFHRARVLGVTATPCRCDGRGLGEWYSELILGPTAQELTDGGHLAPARVLAPPGINLQGLRKRMGDYDLKQAADLLGTGQAMGSPLSHYRQHLEGHTAIAFCCSVSHAEGVARLFTDHGIPAASIDGTMDAATRRQLLQQLGSGEIRVLTSCALIGEGVDVPSVGGCILLRPTQSLALHLQMIGRCLRPQPGKVAVVLDHVGNCHRHGLPTDDREWTLDGVTRRQREQAPSVRVCPACFCAMRSGTPVCPECGHQFVPERRELEHVEGELVDITSLPPLGPYKIGDVLKGGARISEVNENGWLTVFDADGEWRPHSADVEFDFRPDARTLKYNKGDLLDVLDSKTWQNGIATLAQLWVDERGKTWAMVQSTKANISKFQYKVSIDNIRPSRQQRRAEQSSAQSLADLIAIGHRRGMAKPQAWARHVMAAREAKRARSGPVRVVA